MLPEEITRPPEEKYSTNAPEFSLPPDEFIQQTATAATPKKKRKTTQQKKQKMMQRNKLKTIQLAAGAMATVAVIGVFVGLPHSWFNPHPFEKEELESYPNPGGICNITVYADYFDNDIYDNPIIMEQTVQEDEFTELMLPESPVYEGCSALGYVIEYSSGSAYSNSIGYNPGSKAFAVDVGFSLTLDEIQKVPVWEEDRIRHVIVHPIWVANDRYINWEYAPIITLDSGVESVSYRVDLPLVSAACFYTCAMIPEKEGYTFAGWYNEQDQRVYFIRVEDLLREMEEKENHIDWTKPIYVTLTAKWIKNR